MPKKKPEKLTEIEGIVLKNNSSASAALKIKEARKKNYTATQLFDALIKGDVMALGKAITIIESTKKEHQEVAQTLIKKCLPYANNSVRIGITGVPGVGKSTFIESFGTLLTQKGNKVAVLAVDPSSSISKGSILGDKTRMEALVKNPNAFIRPSASGESLGGVARKTREAIILCEAAGFNIIIIETVGVGQSETAVHSMTDFFLLLKLAGAGDELQGIKRGIMEMADAIVINKADGENIKAAQLAKLEFNKALHLYPMKQSGWMPKTLTCSAIKNEGVDAIWKIIEDYINSVKSNQYFNQKRTQQNTYWLLQTIENSLKSNFYDHPKIKIAFQEQLQLLKEQKTTPFEAAEVLLKINI